MVSTIRVLSENDIEQLLALGDALEIVNLMADALAAYTLSRSDPDKHKDAQAPHRLTVTTDNHKVLFMPSRLGTTTSVKIVSVPLSDNSKTGLPGTTVVLNEDTGEVEAVMNAAALTAVRTAAGSALATRYYALENAQELLVLGAGAQARAHVDMMLAVRPTIRKVTVWNRGPGRREKLVSQLLKAYPNLTVVGIDNDSLEQAARSADIICTCTNATQPVLRGAWLKPDVHLNCVGSYRLDMREVDQEAVAHMDKIIVDSIEACSAEAGELVAWSKQALWTEIGQVVLIDRTQPIIGYFRSKRTMFKSVGISVQDSAIAGLMLKRAKELNIGSSVPY